MELTAEASIREVLLARATCSAGSLALLAPQRRPLSYAGLLQQVEGVVAWLHSIGVRRDDPVAIVLPSGPEMAVACLGGVRRRRWCAAESRLPGRTIRFLSIGSQSSGFDRAAQNQFRSYCRGAGAGNSYH